MILLYANTHLAGSNSDPLPSHMESIPTNGPQLIQLAELNDDMEEQLERLVA